jgi:hypothetical protein
MKINLLTGILGAALALSPLGFAQQRQDTQSKVSQPARDSDGVQAAIAFERAKDRAAARQAKLEQRHPSVDYSNADRRMDDSNDGHHVSDPAPAPVKKDKLQP